jgi:hypothetical protein
MWRGSRRFFWELILVKFAFPLEIHFLIKRTTLHLNTSNMNWKVGPPNSLPLPRMLYYTTSTLPTYFFWHLLYSIITSHSVKTPVNSRAVIIKKFFILNIFRLHYYCTLLSNRSANDCLAYKWRILNFYYIIID